MNEKPIIILDADAIIAQTDPKDPHNQKATLISQKLIDMEAIVLYPATAIVEANAYIQRVLNDTFSAYEIAKTVTYSTFDIAEVNKQTIINALEYFSPKTSKKNTLFDCIVAAIAKENNADAIFSFDKFYKRLGFKLASEYI